MVLRQAHDPQGLYGRAPKDIHCDLMYQSAGYRNLLDHHDKCTINSRDCAYHECEIIDFQIPLGQPLVSMRMRRNYFGDAESRNVSSYSGSADSNVHNPGTWSTGQYCRL